MSSIGASPQVTHCHGPGAVVGSQIVQCKGICDGRIWQCCVSAARIRRTRSNRGWEVPGRTADADRSGDSVCDRAQPPDGATGIPSVCDRGCHLPDPWGVTPSRCQVTAGTWRPVARSWCRRLPAAPRSRACQEADDDVVVSFGQDDLHSGDQRGVLGRRQRRVAEQRADRGQPIVASGDAVPAAGFQVWVRKSPISGRPCQRSPVGWTACRCAGRQPRSSLRVSG